jgi:hypothetical protein
VYWTATLLYSGRSGIGEYPRTPAGHSFRGAADGSPPLLFSGIGHRRPDPRRGDTLQRASGRRPSAIYPRTKLTTVGTLTIVRRTLFPWR